MPIDQFEKRWTYSGGVEKLSELSITEESCTLTVTGSFPSPPFPKLFVWKLKVASVKPYLYVVSWTVFT